MECSRRSLRLSKPQSVALGYRMTRNLVAVVYLAAGKLNFSPAT
jgi:hypothetical protein